MCGIAALIAPRGGLDAIHSMVEELRHRGPDDAGTAVFAADGAAFGMRRLSIVDVGHGRQPMWSENEQVAVVFNGEIYNASELRRKLEAAGHTFATDHSDTEVLVHGYEEWGDQLPERLDGMFAVAIWDRGRREFFVARDRFGEKPLYVARTSDGWAIASEIKALVVLPQLNRELDLVGIAEYLSFDFAVAPRTLLKNVAKLPPASAARISASAGMRSWRYWKPVAASPISHEEEQLEELDRILDSAVASRLVADVPIGLFLSGGLDSTTVGYYMRRHVRRTVSFSIGFEESAFDESPYAELAARHLEIEHQTEILSQRRVLELLPSIVSILDEPMADQSVLPTYLLSLFTREHVKVALGGDGSDELFMGYKAYLLMQGSWMTPAPLAARAARLARHLPAHAFVTRRGAAVVRDLDLAPRQRLLSHLGAFKGDGRFVLAPSVRAGLRPPLATVMPALVDAIPAGASPPLETSIAYLETYLANDILTKVDRASMAASLEVRAPFLHPDVAAFALMLPTRQKLRGLGGKYLLKKLMAPRLPAELTTRRKMGFGIPIDAWFRGELADLAREALAPERTRARGLLDQSVVARLLDEHVSGRRNHGRRLWSLVQLELWCERWVDQDRTAVERRAPIL